MDDYYSDSQPELIHCAYCGQDYAATYKACPFCNTAPNGKKVRSHSGSATRGNKRVRTNTRGGGYGGARSPLSVIGIILSVILILAAVVIVIVLAKSAIDKRRAAPAPAPSVSASQVAEPTDKTPAASTPDTSEVVTQPEDTIPEPQAPAVVSPDSLTLNTDDETLTLGETVQLTATVSPADWEGQIVWSSSDGSVATVDQTGSVTYVAGGTCTVTATAGEVTASCIVRCRGASIDDVQASGLTVSCYGNTDTDFTINVGDSVPFVASGGSGDYRWSIADESIATVSDSGTCKGVSAGKTTMTVSDGEKSISITIRVQG
ncbi:MAG: Ig-like domain-containing protein [Oscillospiraceae bacterium]|nr:Ig-like domain-containing protein [Oscillospiraceae bacterium]